MLTQIEQWYTLQTPHFLLPEYDYNYEEESGCEDDIDKKRKNCAPNHGDIHLGTG